MLGLNVLLPNLGSLPLRRSLPVKWERTALFWPQRFDADVIVKLLNEEEMTMSIEQHGGFLELVGEDGVRNLVRINAVQWLCDADETREETFLTVANRTILVGEPLDQIKLALRPGPTWM